MVTVADQTQLNYEALASFGLVVRATDDLGANTSAAVTVTLLNVNESPAGSDKLLTVAKNTPYSLNENDFGFADVDVPSNLLLAVKITSLPLTRLGH